MLGVDKPYGHRLLGQQGKAVGVDSNGLRAASCTLCGLSLSICKTRTKAALL